MKNHKQQDKMIEDYITLKEKIKKRNLEERSDLIDYRRDLAENFEPVVASNKEMAKEIINELTPITKELQDLNNEAKLNVEPTTTGVKRNFDSVLKSENRQNSNLGPYTEEFLNKYSTRSNEIDTIFGIRYENGPWMIGNKQIKIDEYDDIRIDDELYVGTPGLWSLITSKTPTNYTDYDLQRYKELLYETSALHQHYNSKDPYPRASRSTKWKHILGPIWNEFQMSGMTPPSPPMNSSKTSFYNNDTDSLDGTIVDDDDRNDDSDSNESFHSIASEGESSTKGDGIKMYLQKQGRCFGLEKCGNGLKSIPRPKWAGIRGDGLYLRVGSGIYDGRGLILGSKSPFKNIPILGWIL